jgi:hypothetical protein
MKKLFTLFCLVAIVFAASAQTNYKAIDAASAGKVKPAPSFQKRSISSTERAATYNLVLDYDGIDETYSSNAGFDYKRFLWNVNKNYDNSRSLDLDYFAVMFDTLMYVDQNSGTIKGYPKTLSTVTVDSFDILFIHSRLSSAGPDTIKFTVFDLAQKVVTGYGTPAATFTTPSLWDTTIITSTTIPLNTTNYTLATFYPGITLAQGQRFGIRVDFAGDTANSLQAIAGYRDECGAACGGEISIAGNNAAYYLNLTTSTGSPLSGYYENFTTGNIIFYDCDASGGHTDGACENLELQNFVVIPYVTVDVNYGVTIQADSLRGCPNTQINLSADAFGSGATPYTYAWSTTNGTLTSTSGEQTSLVVGTSNATVSVTVTDANNATTVASVVVQSRGITVSFANPTITLNCGSTQSLIPTVGGIQSGKTYNWSTGAASTATFITADMAGTYSVTVSNNVGCSATASVTVQYPGNLQNTISFTLPDPSYCVGKELTFTNTSARTSGWNYRWTYGNGDFSLNQNGVYIYTQAGFYSVKLEQDSAGCKFASAPQSLTVNQICTGVEDVEFAQAVSLMPNPTNGNLTVNVNGAEKKLTLKVYNIIGSEVMNFSTTDVTSAFTHTFDMSNLNNGTYLVKIETGNKVAVKRLTVAK